MISMWLSVIVMLVAFVNGARNEDDAFHIEWRLGEHLFPGNLSANESSIVSEVFIPSFNHTRSFLACCVRASTVQVVGGVEIRAGYPPEAPQNTSCQTNLTTPNTLTCSWDPGQQETHLLTKYSLHTEIWDTNENFTYKLPARVHRYIIPRTGFGLFSDMKIYVKAVNELGETTSEPIILEPVSAAKFDPPILKIQAVPRRYGCLQLSWSLSQQQAWMRDFRLNLEVRLKTADSRYWSEQPILVNRVKQAKSVDQCRLRPGTQYLAQIRVRYQQSPWSEWSRRQSGVTLETAPTGRLDSWMKVSGDHLHKQLNIQLFWKPSKQFRANGQNVSYIVSGKKLPDRAVVSGVSVIPQGDRSLLVQWKSLVSSTLTGFVVEWRPLLKTDLSFAQFEITDRNQTSLVITGSFEPYKPYGISVYPRFKDGIGLPQTVNAYLRQKAPSMVPKIQIKKSWQSHVELTWDEIPLDQRNGNIQSYKVFYCYKQGTINVVGAEPGERRVVLKGLDTESVYEAFMMVSTSGGSLNGSTIHFKIEPFDAVAVVTFSTVSGVGMSLLLIIVVMTCFSNQKRLKQRFWPAVPDPANSSIKRWTSESTQDSHLDWDNEEPNPMYLSHLSFLEFPVKLSKEDDDAWLSNAEDTSDLGESICGSPFLPGYSGSNCDSVPYATVIFSGPCDSPTSKDPHAYLRSESTQPLLETEESFTPKCYQNMATDEQCFFGPCHDCVPEKGTDPRILWDDFPFLRALALNDSQID
ncbi:Granulocyte colony-stimulating factor receptor [Dissostichus eleginoides]|uniref:Granulocyte colony-stimulating factor receptor n=1 Tax=Dissostichus eleginoides TaxID=100907 RepID=A0AAD9C4B1_DISEL|nr:Granulocyte colony-stimulating factor receptor [Dissostichus eleginoides]